MKLQKTQRQFKGYQYNALTVFYCLCLGFSLPLGFERRTKNWIVLKCAACGKEQKVRADTL